MGEVVHQSLMQHSTLSCSSPLEFRNFTFHHSTIPQGYHLGYSSQVRAFNTATTSAKHAYAPETWEHTGGLGAKQHLQEQFEYSRSLPGMAGNSVESLCIIMPRTESAWESQE